MRRINYIFLLISFLFIFKPGEHLGGFEIMFLVIEFFEPSIAAHFVFEILGLFILVYSIFNVHSRYIKIKIIASVFLLWLSLFKYINYYISSFDFIGNHYLFLFSILPFLIMTLTMIKAVLLPTTIDGSNNIKKSIFHKIHNKQRP